jgi:hypothetical protein
MGEQLIVGNSHLVSVGIHRVSQNQLQSQRKLVDSGKQNHLESLKISGIQVKKELIPGSENAKQHIANSRWQNPLESTESAFSPLGNCI